MANTITDGDRHVPDAAETLPAESLIPEPSANEMGEQSPGTERLLLVIMAAVFMVSAEARVVAPLLPAVAQDFDTSVPRTGLLITAYTIPYGLFQLIYGPLADRFSRQRVMGVALSLFSLGTFLSGFAPSLVALDLLRLGTGAAAAGVIPVALAYVGDAIPYGQRQAALGRVVSVASLGGVLSAALGGLIASVLSWRAMFLTYGVIAEIVAVVMLRMPVRRARPGGPARRGAFAPYADLFKRAGRRALALYGLVFIEGLVATSTVGYLGAFLYERDKLSYATIGALLTLNGVSSMLTARIVGRLVIRLGERGMVVTGGMMIVVAYAVLGLRPMPLWFPLGMLVGGSGFVIAHSTLQTNATELVPSLRGTAVAIFAFALFLGGGLGTWIAGLMIDQYGFSMTLAATAVGALVFAACSWPLINVMQKGGTMGQ
jgi:predicted MFS family arabinose efflux permease